MERAMLLLLLAMASALASPECERRAKDCLKIFLKTLADERHMPDQCSELERGVACMRSASADCLRRGSAERATADDDLVTLEQMIRSQCPAQQEGLESEVMVESSRGSTEDDSDEVLPSTTHRPRPAPPRFAPPRADDHPPVSQCLRLHMSYITGCTMVDFITPCDMNKFMAMKDEDELRCKLYDLNAQCAAGRAGEKCGRRSERLLLRSLMVRPERVQKSCDAVAKREIDLDRLLGLDLSSLGEGSARLWRPSV